MVKKIITVTFLTYFLVNTLVAQEQQDTFPKYFFFGNIFADFYHDISNNVSPPTGFEMATALLGYHTDLTSKIHAQIIYDVTRTTNDIRVLDSNNIPLTVSYFEGSKYTAFLKQAEMDWQFASHFVLSVGQLLNQQYLTVQDKFWGYRFVAVTFQEAYRFGNPADFGMRLSYHLKNKILWSIGSVNGDGPFKYQDKNGTLQYFNIIEYRPNQHIILKLYSDLESYKELSRMTNSLFLAYKTELFRIGFEYNRVDFDSNSKDKNFEGSSLYTSIKLNDKLDIFARYDGLFNYTIFDHEHKYFLGLCYSNHQFQTAVNLRYFTFDNSLIFYWSFGIKF